MGNYTTDTAADASSLLVSYREINDRLAQFDASNPAHRRAVLDAVEQLIENYILPAMDLPSSRNRFDIIDLDAVAGTEIPGLVRRLFDERMPADLRKPNDEELKEALDYIDVPTESAEHRDRFYRAWAANMAESALGTLLNFLRQPLQKAPSGLAAVAQQERQRLSKLLQHQLPDSIEYDITSLIERMKLIDSR